MSTDLTERLRAEFDARAETLFVGSAPLDEISHRIGTARSHRRRRAFGTLAGAMALIVAAVLVPNLSGGAARPAPEGGAQTTAGGVQTTAVGGLGNAVPPFLSWPTRGNLAGDSTFVSAANTEARTYFPLLTTTPGGPVPTTFKLLYVEDDGRSRVIIAAEYSKIDGSGHVDLVDLSGPSGASARALSLRVRAEESTASTDRLAFEQLGGSGDSDSELTLVVLGPTTMTSAEYSTAPRFRADGTTYRTGTPMTVVDGAAIAELNVANAPMLETANTTSIKTVVDGQVVYPEESTLFGVVTFPLANQPLGAFRTALATTISNQHVLIGKSDPLLDVILVNAEVLAGVADVPFSEVQVQGLIATQGGHGTIDAQYTLTAPGLPVFHFAGSSTAATGETTSCVKVSATLTPVTVTCGSTGNAGSLSSVLGMSSDGTAMPW